MARRNFIKISAMVMAAALCASSVVMAGCDRKNQGVQGEKYDETKTQLFVQNFDGGGGSQWLYDVKDRFEEKYKDVSFEDGKRGVQLMITPNKVVGTAFSPKTSSQEVFFIEAMSYFDYASAGDILDISDIAEKVFAQEGVSIDESYYNALSAIDKDGNGKGEVYALPHYEFYSGVAYNKNIWNTYALYFEGDANGYANIENGEYVYTNKAGTLSRGPDRKRGTNDDGLPETWEEFFALCDYMLSRSVTPINITGQYQSYFYYFLYSAVADYGGYDELNALISYDGALEYVTGITENPESFLGYDFTKQSVEINNSNGYLGSKAASKFVALAVAEKLLAKENGTYKYFHQPSLLSTVSHLDAQEYYINSQYYNTPIAMHIDGSWWENEASEAFASLAKIDPQSSKMNSSYGWMSLPTSIDRNDRSDAELKQTAYDQIRAYAAINANIAAEKIDLAKEFLAFCYSKEELQLYTQSTGLPKGLHYELTDSNLNQMSSYAKDLWNYRKNRTIVHPITNNPLVIYEAIGLDSMWTTNTGLIPYIGMYDSINAKAYFEDMEVSQARWNADYSRYF